MALLKTTAQEPSSESLAVVADSMSVAAQQLMTHAKSEEDLRIGFEKILEPLLRSIGLDPKPRYERYADTAAAIYKGRPDAVHGRVIIEYEKPGSFRSARVVQHAYDQLVGYIKAESGTGISSEHAPSKLIGVGFDGNAIFFVQHSRKKSVLKKKQEESHLIQLGPYPFETESARTLLTYLRSLVRRPLTAEQLAESFGPASDITVRAVSAFADSLENWDKNPRVRVFFNEWKRIFGIVYGEHFSRSQKEEAEELAKHYKVGSDTDFQELLFSVHTYFVLLMKLITAELLTLKETAYSSSYSTKLTYGDDAAFLATLSEIEDGGIYAKRGITNFLEGDFFRWYIDALSPRVKDSIRDLARELAAFEPATAAIDPDATKDLLKKLYQYLVPTQVRHRLGEYYTPDWLAELLIEEVGFDGNARKRFLDPACGSGTFLVLAIQQVRKFAVAHKLSAKEAAQSILGNIWGFDLNPLAVIASRTNYLFALGDYVNDLDHIELPVYLADSVLTPTRTTPNLFGEYLEVPTSIKKFQIPAIWVRESGALAKAASLVEQLITKRYSVDEAMQHLKREGLAPSPHEQAVETFYKSVLDLEAEGKDHIWPRFLKNAFAPTIAGQFDFVIGNPPWIRWGYLAQDYREATLPLWKDYGLFSLKGHAARLGAGEKDFSMLFTYAAADYYLKPKAKLGFLITQEVLKSKGAGEGFRRFRLGESETYLKVIAAHDFVTVQPFEGATNKTAAIILQKGGRTTYPLPYTVWTKRKGAKKIATDATFEDAIRQLQKKELSARPIGGLTSSWQTISKDQMRLASIGGASFYKARRGASTDPYGIFWLEVTQVLSNGNLLIRNMAKRGKLNILQVEEAVEPDLIYPAANGADINRWGVKPSIYLLVTQNPETRVGYPEETMKANWSRTYDYISRFKQALVDRAVYRKYHKGPGNPYWSQYNIASYTFSNFKVVWKRMANDIVAAVVAQHKTPFGFKTIVPTDTTAYFSTDVEDEAHYLCAIINSGPVREYIKSYSAPGRGFGAPSVMEHVGIARFDSTNKLHAKLATLSKNLHEAHAGNDITRVSALEDELDTLVKQLFRID